MTAELSFAINRIMGLRRHLPTKEGHAECVHFRDYQECFFNTSSRGHAHLLQKLQLGSYENRDGVDHISDGSDFATTSLGEKVS